MRDFSLIKKRILQFLDYKEISKYECYKNTGITNGVLSQSNGMSEDNILRFLSYYTDMSTDWLLTGNGPMLKNAQNQTSPQASSVSNDFIYQMYKEKEIENKELTTRIVQMAEEIGKLKAQLDNQKNPSEQPLVVEKTTTAFMPGTGAGSGKEVKETDCTRIPTLPTKPLHGKR